MKWTGAQQIAEWISEGGRLSYAEAGEVDPAMFLVAETGTLIVHPHPSYADTHPTDIYADILWKVGGLYPWHYVGTCSEAWVQRMEPTPEELAGGPIEPSHDLPRGALEALHEQGDPSVQTCVLVYVLDLKSRFESYVSTSVVENERPISWKIDGIDVTDGRVEGAMGNALVWAWTERRQLPPEISTPSLPMIAELLVEAEIANACMVVNP